MDVSEPSPPIEKDVTLDAPWLPTKRLAAWAAGARRDRGLERPHIGENRQRQRHLSGAIDTFGMIEHRQGDRSRG